ncbi:MAG: acyl-CoA thioesterase [Bacteroidia bacterium]|nr:acyl-CoA thioesterase [Bacteroidia bacterium]
MTYKDFKHIIPIQIRFHDIDRLNHVNNACYHNYFEMGRVKYFDEILKRHVNWDKYGFILARTEIDHLIAVHLHDEIYCCTRVIHFGNKSMKVKNVILKKEGERFIECASGFGILVAMDYSENKSIPVPQQWREQITAFEGSMDVKPVS